MAMGAVLGIAAWTRGQEKLAGINYNNSSINTEQSYNDPSSRNTRND